jgi:hypothetical protein
MKPSPGVMPMTRCPTAVTSAAVEPEVAPWGQASPSLNTVEEETGELPPDYGETIGGVTTIFSGQA